MRNIFELLQEKEQQLHEKQQAVKVLEEQIAKLRGAIDIMKEVLSEDQVLGPEKPAAEPTATARPAQAAAAPSRNWP